MIFVDTNVILDVATFDPNWAIWSLDQLELASASGPLLINEIVYAELSVGYTLIEELDDLVEQMELEMLQIPRSALFLAGKAYQRYRQSGGTRTGVLPDFFIGAHAAVLQVPVLTRDVARYRAYFPTVRLIAPQ
ncbi:type II toxin-antitoxin system VapC family toxin [Mesorhizobium sp. J428]|uniref:type II toxin-antitoxin system VapC family toxin n=1 Tax=Mesorhizobium sp. J428 TaxID=2898440 RepID=UPI002151CA30|nr:type II toxin-antitoxin system VapC family toxin [Mesorhizobium sp. J428]MCR5858754.1 type II toxin-antitoxin system VapC family toxin [Mesorhizobium sp. J428]